MPHALSLARFGIWGLDISKSWFWFTILGGSYSKLICEPGTNKESIFSVPDEYIVENLEFYGVTDMPTISKLGTNMRFRRNIPYQKYALNKQKRSQAIK